MKLALYLFLSISALAQSRVIQPIIPQEVPPANKTGNGTKFQIASSASTCLSVAGAVAIYDSNGNVTCSVVLKTVETALSTPSAPVITNHGAAGSTAYSYIVFALNSIGRTPNSASGATATGNAALDGTNYNIITTAAVSGSTSCVVGRVNGNGVKATFIGTVVCGSPINDQGVPGSGDLILQPNPPNSTAGATADNLSIPGVASFGDQLELQSGENRYLTAYKSVAGGNNAAGVFGVLQTASASDHSTIGSVSFANIPSTGTGSGGDLDAAYNFAYNGGAGAIAAIAGTYSDAETFTGADAFHMAGSYVFLYNGGRVDHVYGSWIDAFQNDGTVVTEFDGYRVEAPITLGMGVVGAAYSNDNMTTCGGDCYAWKSEGGENNLKTGAPGTVGIKILADAAQSADLLQWTDDNEVVLSAIASDGTYQNRSKAFAALGTPANGRQTYCSDCKITSAVDNTCATGGTGAMAFRVNGAWKCLQ